MPYYGIAFHLFQQHVVCMQTFVASTFGLNVVNADWSAIEVVFALRPSPSITRDSLFVLDYSWWLPSYSRQPRHQP